MDQYEGWCEIMASSKEYLHFILEQLSDLDDISYRSMMGEYILYYRGKIVGGVYDDRLLVKKTRSALKCMPAAASWTGGVWVRKGGGMGHHPRCKRCGKLSSNRVAADDNPTKRHEHSP